MIITDFLTHKTQVSYGPSPSVRCLVTVGVDRCAAGRKEFVDVIHRVVSFDVLTTCGLSCFNNEDKQ